MPGSITGKLFPIDDVERVVIFDCLYGTLKSSLDRIKAFRRNAVHITAYVATGGGNSFIDPKGSKSFDKLVLGRVPGWNHINHMSNSGNLAAPTYLSVTSARVVNEGRSAAARILDTMTTTYETSLHDLISKVPPRNLMVSSQAVFTKVRGSLPAGAVVLETFTGVKANQCAIKDFNKHIGMTWRYFFRAQLLGWRTPPGEERHDMILIEFAWGLLS